MNKRQRVELEEEERSLDKKLHPEDNDGSEDKDLEEGHITAAEQIHDNSSDDDEEEDFRTRQSTPPRRVQRHCDDVPLVNDSKAVFRHDIGVSQFMLSETDQALYNEAANWFKSKIGRDTESTIQNLRDDRFREHWIHDLLYDRLKLLRTGINSQSDENTYTSFWVMPDFVALQTGLPGLISKGFANENHFTPSAWRRALSRRKNHAKGTNVDAYYVARDDYVDIIFENVGSPSCADHVKHREDKEKSYRNAADALLERFYNSTGSFEIAQGYNVIIVIVFGHDLSVYTTNIKDVNEFHVSKVFQGKYHFSKDVYLANILLHLKFCLTMKTIMERNIDVSLDFGNSIESLPIEEQAHFNLRLHTTPKKRA
ncbi:hypothetical protein BG004_000541 [Podila humilis]|nr:hypothetical protein BG004_000541 [Podila humilis]